MRSQPLISLVLSVKNGLPHLRRAMEALVRQTYRNFELIVQDGESTDGSLQYLHSIRDLEKIEILSQRDNGIGQAYNRGIARAKGDVVCLVSSDEYLDDDALQRGVEWLSKFPSAAVVYGGVRLADADGGIFQIFIPPVYEFNGVIRNEIILPAGAAFFHREKIGADLYYDESLRTCPDYDFWIRLGVRFGSDEIVRVREPVVTARGDRVSQTFRAESFDQFCRDKISVLTRFLGTRGDGPEIEELRKTGIAGILTWAAESVFHLEGVSQSFLKWCGEAAKVDPQSARLQKLARRTQAFEIDLSSGRLAVNQNAQPDVPSFPTDGVTGLLSLEAIQTFLYWDGAEVQRDEGLRVVTGPSPWSFAAQIPLDLSVRVDEDRWYWVKLNVQVLSGQIGIGLFADGDLCNEGLILPSGRWADVWVKISQRSAAAVMIRNGSFPGRSVVAIAGVTVESCPKLDALGAGNRSGAVTPSFDPAWTRAAGLWPVDLATDPDLRKSFDLLRTKWDEVPYNTVERRRTSDLVALPDEVLVALWDEAFENSTARGWYHTLYRDVFRGKKVLDVGCGMGQDTVFFAMNGAAVTAIDVVPSNIELLNRVCNHKALHNVASYVLDSLLSLEAIPRDFDFILCSGSLIHAPLEICRIESQALLRHLLVGGRWVELGYPKARWLREGSLSPEKWGDRTDGGAPWVEWHDLHKLRYLWEPATFDVVLNFEYHDSDFNWFDLIRRS